jgi:peptidoglycan/xylan/chitin deacetylase (PgdA/CDA1 family)
MIETIQRVVRATDSLLARAYLSCFQEKNGLLSFLFHSLFRDEAEIALNEVDPLQRTTVDQFRRFVEYYLEHDYRFIAAADLLEGLAPDRKYAVITFDDGYFNNTLALPILEEYGIPATFFVSTENVRQNKCFWWDILYREHLARGTSPRALQRARLELKSKTTEQIEAALKDRFGAGAFVPHGDIDRPFTPAELREFAKHRYVALGNHTANHAILTNYTPDEARKQVMEGQRCLEEMTGIRPSVIAYPNGAHSVEILETCEQAGLKVGFTITPGKNPIPVDSQSTALLRLGRFAPLGDYKIETQCRTYRSDLLLYGALRAGYLWLHRGRIAS